MDREDEETDEADEKGEQDILAARLFVEPAGDDKEAVERKGEMGCVGVCRAYDAMAASEEAR